MTSHVLNLFGFAPKAAEPAPLPTTESVLSTYRKTLDELKQVEALHFERAEQKRVAAQAAQMEAEAATKEARHAAVAIGKLQSIFG